MTVVGEPMVLTPVGDSRPCGSNTPLLLDNRDAMYLVVSGGVDVFAAPVRDGRLDGPREFMFRLNAGELLPGFGFDSRGRTTLIAVGSADTRVAPLDTFEVRAYAQANPAVGASLLSPLLVGLATAFGEATRPAPRVDLVLDEPMVEHEMSVPPGASVGTFREVRWVETVARGLYVLDVDFQTLGVGDPPFPLSCGAWLAADQEGGAVPIRVYDTEALIATGRVWEALHAFQEFALEWAARHRVAEERLRIVQMRTRMASDQETRASALTALADVMSASQARRPKRGSAPLQSALDLIATALGVQFRLDVAAEDTADPLQAARRLAESSGVGCRRVLLESAWWTREAGPLLGVLELRNIRSANSGGDDDGGDRLPVALLPNAKGGYVMVEGESGLRTPVNADLARHLAPFGMQFYRGLPVTPVRVVDLWRFVTHDVSSDARTLMLIAALGTVLGLVVPLLTGYLFDDVIPSAERGALLSVGLALAAATCTGVLFEITRTIASTRLHTKVSTALQMAVIDRLVRLPATFFRDFGAGELGQRAMGVQTIGAALGGGTLSAILSSVTGLGALGLLLVYSVPLALVSMGLLLLNITVSAFALRRSLRVSRDVQRRSGELSSLMLELLRSMAKLRVAGAEARAFSRWSDIFREQLRVHFHMGLYSLNLDVFVTVLEIGSTIVLFSTFSWMAASGTGSLTTGEFLSFASAQGMFIGAGLALSGVAMDLIGLLPTWERVKPLLQATPETSVLRPSPGVLTGHIEINQLRFGYGADSPLILDGVSLEIHPNQFVALVGPSGSGKSTLLRLLLGFEKPLNGSLRYDGQELATIDVAAVRRQIGVVLQNATLTAGDLYSNIVGAGAYTLQDAWEAVRMAGMEADLRAMPMGLHTVVSEGGGTLSGGQRQRLLIARALVGRPRLLLFDEATSALDNTTQRIVSESVERLHATRVVVAHRLSTIRYADLIVVLDGGRIVEQGTYDVLMAQDGLFAALAARQGE